MLRKRLWLVLLAAPATAAVVAAATVATSLAGTTAHSGPQPQARTAAQVRSAVRNISGTTAIQRSLATVAGPDGYVGSYKSPNWAGYATDGPRFRFVAAKFRVPRANCRKTPGSTSHPSMAYIWLGLDGLNPSQTVEQDGVADICENGHAYYAAWWETFPKGPHFQSFRVSPGDLIDASVWYNPKLHKYRLNLTDQSNGNGFSLWERCGATSCLNYTAEVVTESPFVTLNVVNGYVPLADIGTTGFSGVSITDMAGQRGNFLSSHWNGFKVVMTDRAGHVKSSVSGLAGGGSAFDTYWLRAT